MRKILFLTVLGVVLFAGTVVGLLAAQGRLNHAGTRGIPVLSSFFPPPPEPPVDAEGAEHGGPTPANAPPAAPLGETAAAGAAHGDDPHAQRSDGLGREDQVPYRQGKSLFKSEAPAAGGGHGAPAEGDGGGKAEEHGGGEAAAEHGAEKAGGHEAAAAGAHDGQHASSDSHGATRDAGHPEASTEWKAKVDSVLGQGQYRPGRLWNFPQIETGIGVDELNQILLRARQQQLELERDRAALQKQQAELEARERDVADRQDAVLEKLRDVEQMRAKLQSDIDEFHNTVLLIRQDEVAGLQSVAKTLAAVEPKSAAAVIKKWWETEEGQTRALKIWTVMDPDPANAILAELDVEMIRQVLEKRLKVAREQAKGKK
ncbi:MAG: hypothetical protein R3F56_24880 [Planctomycetota bacterium]